MLGGGFTADMMAGAKRNKEARERRRLRTNAVRLKILEVDALNHPDSAIPPKEHHYSNLDRAILRERTRENERSDLRKLIFYSLIAMVAASGIILLIWRYFSQI